MDELVEGPDDEGIDVLQDRGELHGSEVLERLYMHVEMLDLEALDGERDGVLPLLQAVGIIDVDEGCLRPLLYGLLEEGLL